MTKRRFIRDKLNAYWIWILTGILLIFPLVVAGDSYFIHLMSITLIYNIAAQSLNLLLGYTGLVSLGQIGFFAIGSYASSLVVLKAGYSFWIGLLVALAVSTVLGFLVGLVALRFRSHVFAIVTLAFAELVRLTAYNWKGLTGGPDGIFNVPRPQDIQVGSLVINFKEISAMYYLIVVFFVITTVISWLIINRPFGRRIIAIRENETYAEFLGINTWITKVIIFTISSAMASLSGVLYAHYIGYISPYTFVVGQSVNILLMVILGGAGTLIGPLIGSAFVQVIPELLRGLADYRMIIYGAVLVLAVIFMPKGITGIRIRRKRKSQMKAALHGKEQVVGDANDLEC